MAECVNRHQYPARKCYRKRRLQVAGLKFQQPFGNPEKALIFAFLLKNTDMAVTRLKRKNLKDKVKSRLRKQALKLQNAKPVMKAVDIEKVKEEFKAKAAAKKG